MNWSKRGVNPVFEAIVRARISPMKIITALRLLFAASMKMLFPLLIKLYIKDESQTIKIVVNIVMPKKILK